VAHFEPLGAPIDVFPSSFVLVLLLVLVLGETRSITSTSTIRLGGLSSRT
jgi:hypothetical protein